MPGGDGRLADKKVYFHAVGILVGGFGIEKQFVPGCKANFTVSVVCLFNG